MQLVADVITHATRMHVTLPSQSAAQVHTVIRCSEGDTLSTTTPTGAQPRQTQRTQPRITEDKLKEADEVLLAEHMFDPDMAADDRMRLAALLHARRGTVGAPVQCGTFTGK